MGKKRTPLEASWTDFIMGSSQTPSDDLTFTDGSAYGLDAFYHTQTMNKGVDNHGDFMGNPKLEPVKGLSGLPDGFINPDSGEKEGADFQDILGTDESLELTAFFSEEEGAWADIPRAKKATSVMDLAWLDPTQKQDPARLPNSHSPYQAGNADKPDTNALYLLPQLIEAWGVDRRTDGLSLVPNKDRETEAYLQTLGKTPSSELPTGKKATLKDAICRAVRQAHFGVPMEDIKQGLVDSLGSEAVRAKKAVEQIERDYGLAGKVFIRASAFPGLRNGKWVRELKKKARTARYVITDDPAVADKLKMEMVQSIPWAKAANYFVPRMKAAGYQIPKYSKDPQEMLRKMFSSRPLKDTPLVEEKPVIRHQVASVRAAQEALKDRQSQESLVRGSFQDAQQKKALQKMARWVKQGLLSKKAARRINEQAETPVQMLKQASQLISSSSVQSGIYEGIGEGDRDKQMVRRAAASKEPSISSQSGVIQESKKRKALAFVRGLVKSGQLTLEHGEQILAEGGTPDNVMGLASAAIQVTSSKNAPVYSDDLGLTNASLDQIHLEDELQRGIEGISFGGLEFDLNGT